MRKCKFSEMVDLTFTIEMEWYYVSMRCFVIAVGIGIIYLPRLAWAECLNPNAPGGQSPAGVILYNSDHDVSRVARLAVGWPSIAPREAAHCHGAAR